MSEPGRRETKIFYPRGRRVLRRVDRSRIALALLAPLSWAYGISVRCLRAGGAGPHTPGVTVISIGNIEIGGTGKTPLAIHVIEQLRKAGHVPLYLSRGYRSVAEHLDAVTVVVPRNPAGCPAFTPGVRLLARERGGLHREIGDEGAVVARRLPEVPLLFTKHKRRALELARDLFSPTHIVVDDAFQSWRLYRDIDIVLLDPCEPFGTGRLLPAGTLREEPAALGRAHLVGFLGEAGPASVGLVEAAMSGGGIQHRPPFSGRRRISFRNGAGEPVSAPAVPVAAVSAIARPARFEAMLEESGCDLACSLRYPDHYRYTREDIDYIQDVLAGGAVSTAVLTEKDWVKLDEYDMGSIVPLHARLELDFDDTVLLDAIEKPQPGAAVS